MSADDAKADEHFGFDEPVPYPDAKAFTWLQTCLSRIQEISPNVVVDVLDRRPSEIKECDDYLAECFGIDRYEWKTIPIPAYAMLRETYQEIAYSENREA